MSEQIKNNTYGGEAEVLAVNQATRRLTPISHAEQINAGDQLKAIDSRGEKADMGYDSSLHLAEVGGGVWKDLPGVVLGLQEAVASLQQTLSQREATLVSSSHHPLDELNEAYDANVLPKPIYDLLRGKRGDKRLNIHPSVLSKVYTDNPQQGRGWKHEVGTMAASLQPWNSLDSENAAQQIRVLQATGWMMNLLTANSPFIEGRATGKRDSRIEMWGENGIMATSRYESDRQLTRNIPEKPNGLTDYYKYVLSNQRPAVIPYQVQQGEQGQYKTKFLALVQPSGEEEFNAIKYLQSKSFKAVDIETGEDMEITPSVAHLFNGFDFLYFPRHGARLRMNLPNADNINPVAFAEAITNNDEKTFMKLLKAGGVEQGGFLCAEGRVAATVLPTVDHPSWDRFSLPFVLQTAIVRTAPQIEALLDSSGLSWKDLTETLPELTNTVGHGFDANIKGVNARDLALQIWQIAQTSLTAEECYLVCNAIDEMLLDKKGPAEEQIEYVEQTLSNNPSMVGALIALIDHQKMIVQKELL